VSAKVARKLADAGLDANAIATALEAFEAAEEERKAKARERKRRQREREVTGQSVTSRDGAGQGVTPPETKGFPRPLPKTHTPEDVTSHARRAAEPEGFDRFWVSYPRKVGRPKALLAYASALRRAAGPDPPQTILIGLQAHLPGWADTEPELIPHPTTWLNRDGWNDDPPRPRVVPFDERSHNRHRPQQPGRTEQSLAGLAEAVLRRRPDGPAEGDDAGGCAAGAGGGPGLRRLAPPGH
jgi:hypothetical protein